MPRVWGLGDPFCGLKRRMARKASSGLSEVSLTSVSYTIVAKKIRELI